VNNYICLNGKEKMMDDILWQALIKERDAWKSDFTHYYKILNVFTDGLNPEGLRVAEDACSGMLECIHKMQVILDLIKEYEK